MPQEQKVNKFIVDSEFDIDEDIKTLETNKRKKHSIYLCDEEEDYYND